MALSDAITHLTNRLMPLAPDEPHREVLRKMATMHHYIAIRNMTLWEDICWAALEEISPPYKTWEDLQQHPFIFMMHEIYELGIHNMYTKYNPATTTKEYQRVVEIMAQNGVPDLIPITLDLSTW